jgi:hypothetical protein
MTRNFKAATFGTLAFSTMLLLDPLDTAAAEAPFCIAQSGPNGENSYVGNCVYSSYQQCVAATAGSRGDCVGNVDYREGPRAEMTGRSNRRAR